MDTNLITVLFSLFLVATVKSSELMGGHYDNVNENYQREETSHNKYNSTDQDHSSETVTEELIPDPSALIIPGYNLPGHLFNDGKPFYVEKDPLTGAIDFNNKTPAGKEYTNEYEYIDEEPSTNIFDKANIDRKDGGYGSHRPNDVNQLTPNFHDFLNLPVKYNNPEKYVYPLISSSYANTKIQGNNVNSYNHKQYAATTYKPTVSPTYYTTSKSVYYNKPTISENNYVRPSTIEAPNVPLTTEKAQQFTKSPDNLLNSGMNHPSYYLTTEYDYDYFTTQNILDQEVHLTTEPPRKEVYNKPPSTTKKPYSIFNELFGDYEDTEPNEQPSKPAPPPPSFSKLPATNYESKYHNKQNDKIIQVTPSPTRPSTASPSTTTTTTTTTTTQKPITTQSSNKSPSDNNYNPNYETIQQVYPEEENTMYEYEDDYNNNYNENISEEKIEPNRNITNISTEKSVSINIRNETNPKTTKSTTSTTERIYHSSTKPFSNSHQYNIPSSSSSTNIPYSTIKGITNRYSDRFSSLPTFTTEKPDSNFISITSEQYDNYHKSDYKTSRTPDKTTMSTQAISTTKVTSMPLGENHPPHSIKLPVITLTQNLKESLNREKVDTTTKTYLKPVQQYEKKDHFQSQGSVVQHPIPSTSNIRIPADQDIVSFVVGNHQNVDGGHYIGSAMKEESYVSNSFRPLYSQQNSIPVFDQVVYNQPMKASINYGPQPTLNKNISFHEGSSTTINVQPIMGAQASLSIGMPADEIKKVKGEVVDEKLDLNENIEYPKEPGSKIVFPEEDLTTFTPPPKHIILPPNMPNREILSLYSKPVMHQLPADLTPPSEPEKKPVRPPGGNRPPWDPRPGHFYQGRPEYARPPRPPHKPEVYKRIDGLPNILPQFRPNAKVSNGHYMDQVGTINAGYMPRQPLLDRPSNRPIGFFEKLHPPPPPKRIHDLRKVTALEPDMKHDRYRYEERILNIPNIKTPQEHFGGYQMPPKVPVANRKSEDESEIATLQMIQAKQTDKLEIIKPNVPPPFKINYQEPTEKPLYVVYPVNSVPLKLDVLDNDKKETVVVGTRGEHLPLPPSKITQDPIPYEQKPLLKPKDRNDTPLLKPHTRPNNFPIKTDFPYTLERPDPTFMNIPISSVSPDLGPNVVNNLDTTLPTIQYNNKQHDAPINYQSNNQWTSLDTESRIVNGGNKLNYVNDQISATLKTFTDKPIAIAYTPTEPNSNNNYNVDTDKYSVPNFGRPVIPEIRPEANQNVHPYGTVSNDDSEFTVSAIMHTHPQIKLKNQNEIKYYNPDQRTAAPLISNTRRQENLENHKLNLDVDSTHIPAQLDFQAPFHASVSIDSEYQGWSVINQNKKSEINRADVDESPTNQPETSSEFDIENFKPQLFGGFKPIYNAAKEQEKVSTTPERQE